MPEMARPAPATEIGDQVARLRQMWADAFNRRNINALVELYSEDAVLLLPDYPAAIGADAIRELLNKVLPAETRHLRIQGKQVEYTGPLAVEIATYTLSPPASASASPIETGRLVTTWRRMPSGEFQITISVWSSGSLD